jgi:hypothetical protein
VFFSVFAFALPTASSNCLVVLTLKVAALAPLASANDDAPTTASAPASIRERARNA